MPPDIVKYSLRGRITAPHFHPNEELLVQLDYEAYSKTLGFGVVS